MIIKLLVSAPLCHSSSGRVHEDLVDAPCRRGTQSVIPFFTASMKSTTDIVVSILACFFLSCSGIHSVTAPNKVPEERIRSTGRPTPPPVICSSDAQTGTHSELRMPSFSCASHRASSSRLRDTDPMFVLVS